MRTAGLFAIGFIAVFTVSLVVARGSHGPPSKETRFCGVYAPAGTPGRHNYVSYATRMSCARSRTLALAYVSTHVCRRGSFCRARIDGTRCLVSGSAGPGLTWVGCGRTKHIYKPRAFFSLEHPSRRAHARPGLPTRRR